MAENNCNDIRRALGMGRYENFNVRVTVVFEVFFILSYIYIPLVLSVCFCFPKQIQLTSCNHHKLFTTTACARAREVDNMQFHYKNK